MRWPGQAGSALAVNMVLLGALLAHRAGAF